MGIFYNPPQPPTASTGGTTPEPHVPIGTQGGPPPRYQAALMLAAVLASWPADLEPRLQRPNEQRQKIAPLTLTYGSQPSQQSPIAVAEWAPLSAWAQTWNAQRAPVSTAWYVPPIVSAYTPNAPPLSLIWSAWTPPDPLPARPVSLAPLTLAYGSQPPPRPILPSLLARLVGAWDQPWSAQSEDIGASWNVAATSAPYTPLPALIWSAWTDPALPLQRQVAIAPLTLAYGAQPSPQPALSIVELAQLVGSWAQTWDAQTAAKNAGWNVPPILSAVAYIPPPAHLWSAWVPPFALPQTLVRLATLTLPTGQQPPASSSRVIQITSAWATGWDAQSAVKGASWNIPAGQVLATTPPYRIVRTWHGDLIQLPRLGLIAPLIVIVAPGGISGATITLSDAAVTTVTLTDAAVTTITPTDEVRATLTISDVLLVTL